MEFNFYNQYKNLSNIDLLKIVKRSTNYQNEAVEAATQILKSRQVSEIEEQLADKYYQDIDAKAELKKEKISGYKNTASDFLEPIVKPNKDVKPEKWLNILLLLITLQYTWSIYTTIKHLITYLKSDSSFDIFIWGDFVSVLYTPIIFYLLFRRKRWGWILLFADNLFVFISQVSQTYIFFKYQNIHHGSTVSFILVILIRGCFAYFLWQEKICSFFNVGHEIKKKTSVITTGITIAFVVVLNLVLQ